MCVFIFILTTNSHYIPIQHTTIGVFTGNVMCSL